MSEPKVMDQQVGRRRENWASQVGFVLAAAGSAIGLGNIWRFPYLTGTNGGAAFVLIYLAAIILIGYPIMITEMAIGRKSQRNAYGAFAALAPGTPWWLVGALGVLTGFVILSYYSVVGGWGVAYVFKTLLGMLPKGTDFAGAFVGHITATWEPIFWHAVFMGVTTAIIAAGVVKGIQRWSEILMPMLAVCLFILVIRSVTLPGAMAGLSFYLKPDFSTINAKTLLDAVSQAFFSLSLGMGCMITYGSYVSSKEDLTRSAAYVVSLDTAAAFVAGLAILPAVFALGFEPGAGAGLTFITLPAVFAEMPLGGFFGVVFFFLISIAALTSAISLLEVVVAWLVDEKGWNRQRAALLTGIGCFLFGLPTTLGYGVLSNITFLGMDLLDTYDWIANSIFLPLGGLLTAIFAGYVWGTRNVAEEANKGSTGMAVGEWWAFLIRFVVPIAIAIIMLSGIYQKIAG
ncbi:MAG: sodium-dependent transporter [Limnochordia bacterium]